MGILLIVLGGIGLAYGGVSYWHREKFLDLGPFQATTNKKETVAVSPVVGGLLVAGGVALLVFGRKAR